MFISTFSWYPAASILLWRLRTIRVVAGRSRNSVDAITLSAKSLEGTKEEHFKKTQSAVKIAIQHVWGRGITVHLRILKYSDRTPPYTRVQNAVSVYVHLSILACARPYTLCLSYYVNMASLVADYNSSGEEDEAQMAAEVPSVDYDESLKVISTLRERFPLNSAPVVPNKVRITEMGYN